MNKFWSILGWVTSTILAIFLYYASEKQRIPTFIIDPLQPILVDKELFKNRPINILDTAGKYIDGNISVITFTFLIKGANQ